MQDQIESGDNADNLIEQNVSVQDTLYGQARNQFIQKVLTLLGFEVVCTVFTVLLMIYSKSFFTFQQSNTFIFYLALIGWVVGYILLVYRRMDKIYPKNVILLAIYTFGQSYSVSYLCGAYLVTDFANILFIASIMTLGIVIACVTYAYQTKNDFTTNQGARVIMIITVLMLSVFAFFEDESLSMILLCSLATGMYGMYLIINVQVMIGSKQRVLSIDDYMVCALELYTNIVQMFACLLMLLTSKRSR